MCFEKGVGRLDSGVGFASRFCLPSFASTEMRLDVAKVMKEVVGEALQWPARTAKDQ